MITSTEQIKLICQRCQHEWNYKGKNYYVTTCPHCRTSVMFPKELRQSSKSVIPSVDKTEEV
jgi:Zn finger protein HypA/HybF involved in hydrogenase expression